MKKSSLEEGPEGSREDRDERLAKSGPREMGVVDPVDWTKNWVVLGVVG
jgi:hypothetical protein